MDDRRGMVMHTFIGTSGWNYDHWKERFYPAGYPKARWLDYYMNIFSTVEVNATFYRQMNTDTFLKWRMKGPDDFVFSLKANRYITHIMKLKNVEDSVRTFISSVSVLGLKLGPLLFQLPPSLVFDENILETFLAVLPDGYRYTVEARHKSWTSTDALSVLGRHNIAWCIADTAGRFPYLEAVTADFVYIRLHGSKKLYVSDYTTNELDEWAEKIRSWGVDAYVYFDNDFMAHAPGNALQLREILKR